MWQLWAAVGVGGFFFVVWEAFIILLPAIWPTDEVKEARADAGEDLGDAMKKALQEAFSAQGTHYGFVHRNLHLGSFKMEEWRRQVAFGAFLEKVCARFDKGTDRKRRICIKQHADKLRTVLEAEGIITKEHILRLHDAGDGILEEVLQAANWHLTYQQLQADPLHSQDNSVASAGSLTANNGTAAPLLSTTPSMTSINSINSSARPPAPPADMEIKRWARAIKIEASRPLKRTHDPQVLLRGVSTLITLNVFLASAVFIGLSITSPDGVKASLETAYCDLSQQLVTMTHSITGNITTSPRLWGHIIGRNCSACMPESAAGAGAPDLKPVRNCSVVGREFPQPKCSGDDTKKPVLMTQQITAFGLFVGSTGVAFALLLSLQPEGELNEAWERSVAWMPYICFSGISMLLGLLFLVWSLVTMGEVQYGDWNMWAECEIPWLADIPLYLGAYLVACTLVGIFAFFNGWKIV